MAVPKTRTETCHPDQRTRWVTSSFLSSSQLSFLRALVLTSLRVWVHRSDSSSAFASSEGDYGEVFGTGELFLQGKIARRNFLPTGKIFAHSSSAMASDAQLTPMMAQYRRIKGELPKDALLLFRLGDFYEMFFEDTQVCRRCSSWCQPTATAPRALPLSPAHPVVLGARHGLEAAPPCQPTCRGSQHDLRTPIPVRSRDVQSCYSGLRAMADRGARSDSSYRTRLPSALP